MIKVVVPLYLVLTLGCLLGSFLGYQQAGELRESPFAPFIQD